MTSADDLTRDEAHAAQTAHLEQMQKQHPETDLKLETNWMKPATDFNYDLKEKLDEPTYSKMNGILEKIFQEDLDLSASERLMQEARQCLEGHPDLLQQFDTIFGSKGPEFWTTVGLVRKQRSADKVPSGQAP